MPLIPLFFYSPCIYITCNTYTSIYKFSWWHWVNSQVLNLLGQGSLNVLMGVYTPFNIIGVTFGPGLQSWLRLLKGAECVSKGGYSRRLLGGELRLLLGRSVCPRANVLSGAPGGGREEFTVNTKEPWRILRRTEDWLRHGHQVGGLGGVGEGDLVLELGDQVKRLQVRVELFQYLKGNNFINCLHTIQVKILSRK